MEKYFNFIPIDQAYLMEIVTGLKLKENDEYFSVVYLFDEKVIKITFKFKVNSLFQYLDLVILVYLH